MGNGVVTPQRTSNSSQIINYEPIRKVFRIISSEIKWKKPINLRGRACLELVVIQLKNELSVNEIKIKTLQKHLIESQKDLRNREQEIIELNKEIHKLKVGICIYSIFLNNILKQNSKRNIKIPYKVIEHFQFT